MAPWILIAHQSCFPSCRISVSIQFHFSMLMLLNRGIGLCPPPVGAILFLGCAAHHCGGSSPRPRPTAHVLSASDTSTIVHAEGGFRGAQRLTQRVAAEQGQPIR